MADGSNQPSLLALIADWKELALSWGIAIVGGLVRYAQKIAGPDDGERWGYLKLSAKLFLAGFAGMSFYFITRSLNIAPEWKALFIALSGHMGAEAIEFLEGVMKDVIRRAAGSSEDR